MYTSPRDLKDRAAHGSDIAPRSCRFGGPVWRIAQFRGSRVHEYPCFERSPRAGQRHHERLRRRPRQHRRRHRRHQRHRRQRREAPFDRAGRVDAHARDPSTRPRSVRTPAIRPHARDPSTRPRSVRTPAIRPHARDPSARPRSVRTCAGRPSHSRHSHRLVLAGPERPALVGTARGSDAESRGFA